MVQNPLELAYRVFFSRPIAWGRFYGRYSDFDSALRDAPGTLPRDFDIEEAGGMYRERLERIHIEDYPIIHWLHRKAPPGSRIFDLGGHVGIARHAFGRLIPLDETEWVCQDLPAVARAGQALLERRPAPGLRFTSDIADGDGAGIWLALGSIQYFDWRLADRLEALTNPPHTVILSKTPIHPIFDAVTLQNTGLSICPYRVFADGPFAMSMRRAGYRLVERWKNPGLSCLIPFHPEISVPAYTGLLFERT